MRIKRPLAPAFLNRLDEYLLLNKPEIWSARTHMVVYYGILFMCVLAAIAFVVPDDPRTSSDAGSWMGFVSLISLVSFVGWLIYLLRFNVFKRYGLTSPLNRLITFALYFVSIGVLVLFCFVKPVVESIRANAAYTDEEIVNDINAMNAGIARLEYNSMDHTWKKETVVVKEKTPAFNQWLANEDSVIKIDDSRYISYTCPNYTLMYSYTADEHSKVKLLTSVDIYRKYIVNYQPPNKAQLTKELMDIRKKYQPFGDYESYYEGERNAEQRIRERYGLLPVYQGMHHILARKHRWDVDGLETWFRFFFYTTLSFTLLVFAFRHTTARTFFLTLLAAVIILIFTSLILAFVSLEDEVVFNSIIFYFIVALGISITAFTIKKRRAVAGIALNIFLWLLPFIPLCLVLQYYERVQHLGKFDYDRDYALRQQHLFMGEVIGIVLLLLMVGTYFHYAYKKWYAAPEN